MTGLAGGIIGPRRQHPRSLEVGNVKERSGPGVHQGDGIIHSDTAENPGVRGQIYVEPHFTVCRVTTW